MKSFVSKMLITSAALSTLIGVQAAYAQTPDWYRARAIQGWAPPAQVVYGWNNGQTECRYSGGPKYPVTCYRSAFLTGR
jgi:hypothetical protein